MQEWMDGKRTTEVVGVKDYTKPKTGKTAKFNNTDLKYYIKCGYCTVKIDNEEQHGKPTCRTPTKSLLLESRPTPPSQNNRVTPLNSTQPEPQELTEANLNLHNSMLTPQLQAHGHNNASAYSPT